MPVWPHGDPRDLARAIVADSRYAGTSNAAPPAPTLIERVMIWIGDRFADLFHGIGHVLGAHNPFNAAVGIAVLVAAAVALGYLGYRLWPRAVRRAVPRGAVAREGLVSSAEWLERALAAARLERWREAAAYLFTAALHVLDERGRLPYDPARTLGEARRAVNDAAFDAFAREGSIALFDARGATGERFARMRDAYARSFDGRA